MVPRPLTAWGRRHRRRPTETAPLPALLGVPVVDNAAEVTTGAPSPAVAAEGPAPARVPAPNRVPAPTRAPESGAMATSGPDWTGEMRLHLHDVDNRAAGTAVLVLGRDTVRIWLRDREVAVLVRDHLRAWFYQEHPDPYGGYGLFWSFENGQVCLQSGTEFFTVCSDCLRALEAVL